MNEIYKVYGVNGKSSARTRLEGSHAKPLSREVFFLASAHPPGRFNRASLEKYYILV